MAILEVEKLGFAYREAADVLDGVGFSLEEGSFCGLLGPNGSGKTTLIEIVSGALRPQRGRVRFQGRSVEAWDPRELARAVAVVPQRFELAFPFTVQELITLGRLPHQAGLCLDGPEDRAAVRWAMEVTDTARFAGRRAHELSGGEIKRVMVAKALAQKPRLLLLDEPGAHLDIRHQVELYSLVQRVREQDGLTVLAAVHELNLAAAHCDRFVLLAEGTLLAQGRLEDVMTWALLKKAYGIDIYVGVNDLTGQRLFTPMISGEGST
ncbi:MAG: ABC transporter ATP-binding protein [Deltaproteobacteria bacterium]|nr:ABC transporter ATP-binding protein [Deltaproteobacteria bacterium]